MCVRFEWMMAARVLSSAIIRDMSILIGTTNNAAAADDMMMMVGGYENSHKTKRFKNKS